MITLLIVFFLICSILDDFAEEADERDEIERENRREERLRNEIRSVSTALEKYQNEPVHREHTLTTRRIIKDKAGNIIAEEVTEEIVEG